VLKKVLVVDDNGNNLLLERDLLAVAGFEVFEADNAASGIALTRKEKPDVIIMDVRLPDMRGTEAAKILRRDKETCGIPIVFVTASVMAEGMEEIRNIPNSGFIGKPINTRTFVREVSQFMRKKALVIEDNDSNLVLEKDLLEFAGFEVFEASNASSGILLARKEKPDVIIMDLRLPGMRGSEAATILRRDKETGDIPIVFVAATAIKEGTEEIRSITKSGFIGKPINTRTFAREVRQFLD
jgi:CheY-like chemotaxis protein